MLQSHEKTALLKKLTSLREYLGVYLQRIEKIRCVIYMIRNVPIAAEHDV
jgi:hypothetical protein